MREQRVNGPLLFLSHAGADTEAARQLKQRIEEAPAARERGLKVWFDKDDLHAGAPWQDQLAEAIQKHASAFGVYVGSKGAVNWVEAEVRLALSRAMTSGGSFPFVPRHRQLDRVWSRQGTRRSVTRRPMPERPHR